MVAIYSIADLPHYPRYAHSQSLTTLAHDIWMSPGPIVAIVADAYIGLSENSRAPIPQLHCSTITFPIEIAMGGFMQFSDTPT